MAKNTDFYLVHSFKELLCFILGNTTMMVVVVVMRMLQSM